MIYSVYPKLCDMTHASVCHSTTSITGCRPLIILHGKNPCCNYLIEILPSHIKAMTL